VHHGTGHRARAFQRRDASRRTRDASRRSGVEDCRGAKTFRGAGFGEAFGAAVFRGAVFGRAAFRETVFREAMLRMVFFCRTVVRGTTVHQTMLREILFHKTVVRGTAVRQTILREEGFPGAFGATALGLCPSRGPRLSPDRLPLGIRCVSRGRRLSHGSLAWHARTHVTTDGPIAITASGLVPITDFDPISITTGGPVHLAVNERDGAVAGWQRPAPGGAGDYGSSGVPAIRYACRVFSQRSGSRSNRACTTSPAPCTSSSMCSGGNR
jgi:hypothetical protein